MLEIEIFAKQMESKHAMFTFDSCFSGSLFEITHAVPDTISFKTSEPVRQFITAGSAEQTVPDKSVFRNQFVAGLEGDAEVNKDGFITGTELAQYIEESMTNYTRRAQTPQYGKIRDPYLDKGDFVFINLRMEISIRLPSESKPATPNAEASESAIELSYWDAIKSANDPEVYQAYLEEYPEGQFSKLASLLIRQAGKKQEKIKALKQERKEEQHRQSLERTKREEDFKRQRALLAQQKDQSEQRITALKEEQVKLSKLRRALAKKPQEISSTTPEISTSVRKVAVVLRGEVKFSSNANEKRFTRKLIRTYKAEIENVLLRGANVVSITEPSNNHSIAYGDIGGKEVKRVCQEQAVDVVVVGFIEVIDEISWPNYTISYMNCETGSSGVHSYSLDKKREDKHLFQSAIKQGLIHFWRNSISADLQ